MTSDYTILVSYPHNVQINFYIAVSCNFLAEEQSYNLANIRQRSGESKAVSNVSNNDHIYQAQIYRNYTYPYTFSIQKLALGTFQLLAIKFDDTFLLCG